MNPSTMHCFKQSSKQKNRKQMEVLLALRTHILLRQPHPSTPSSPPTASSFINSTRCALTPGFSFCAPTQTWHHTAHSVRKPKAQNRVWAFPRPNGSEHSCTVLAVPKRVSCWPRNKKRKQSDVQEQNRKTMCSSVLSRRCYGTSDLWWIIVSIISGVQLASLTLL